MSVEFELHFKNINAVGVKKPVCRIELNGRDVWAGEVKKLISFRTSTLERNTLKIFFENKDPRDTVLDANNQITRDLNFELSSLIIDRVDLKHLIWESKYFASDTIIDSCLFFGPKGYWQIEFGAPVLKWFLETNHLKNNNDPEWERDYNYYTEAWQKLSKIQTR